MGILPVCVWRFLVVLVLSTAGSDRVVVSAATNCAKPARPAPAVTTIMAAPDDPTNTAWILHPDCKLDIVAVEPDAYYIPKLNCSKRGIGRVESLPTSTKRLFFDHNTLKEADFSPYTNLSQIILAQCNLTTADTFQFPSSLQILDFDENQLQGIAKGTIPDRVEVLYLNRNGLTSLNNFSLPGSLTSLFLDTNAFTTVNFVIPNGLTELSLTNNKALKSIENVTLPASLNKLACTACGVKTFRGVKLTRQLGTIDFSGSTLREFEIRESDVGILRNLKFAGDVSQTSCSDTNATLRQVQPGLPTCVISDVVFEAKYWGGPRPPDTTGGSSTPSPSTTLPSESPSSTTIIIIIVIVAAVVCAVVAIVVYRKCFRGKGTSGHNVDDKYEDIPTLEAEGSSAATAPTGGSSGAPASGSHEYLSNDIRNDERMITYRIAYDEIQIVRVIGRGGFGVVHLAKFRGREVAIKQMLPDKAKDTRVVRSFMDEIRLSASLEHPRIVEFIGVTWSTLQDMAVVNEYMAGGDLRAALDKQQHAPDAAQWFEASQGLKAKSAVALDVVGALVYLHSFGQPIIHRDLKARNVLINADGDAKLSDFGTSREALLDETMTGEIGTVAWIAPEVLRGERYSEKADIYSLGVLLVELDTARHPYKRELSEASAMPQSNTRIALLVSSGQLAPSPSEACPSEVATVISSCLSYDPQNRPSAMGIHYEMRKIFRQSK